MVNLSVMNAYLSFSSFATFALTFIAVPQIHSALVKWSTAHCSSQTWQACSRNAAAGCSRRRHIGVFVDGSTGADCAFEWALQNVYRFSIIMLVMLVSIIMRVRLVSIVMLVMLVSFIMHSDRCSMFR